MLTIDVSTRLLTMTRFPHPGCWFRFTPADWYFIRDTLATNERDREGFNAILDDPQAIPLILDNDKLFEAVVISRQGLMVSPELFFFLVIRHTLKERGISQMQVSRRLSALLSRLRREVGDVAA